VAVLLIYIDFRTSLCIFNTGVLDTGTFLLLIAVNSRGTGITAIFGTWLDFHLE
jgi:hypothetical protein